MLPDKNARILVVEPDFIIAESLSVALVKQGYSVDVAHTAVEAVEMAVRVKPHILIVEPYLQTEMQGVEVANTILSFSTHTEVILIGYGRLEKEKNFSTKKPCETVSKPYDEAEIIQAVDKCLEAIRSTNPD